MRRLAFVLVAARLAGAVATRSIVAVGLAATAVAAVVLLIGALVGMPLPIALIGFFVLMSAQGLVGPNSVFALVVLARPPRSPITVHTEEQS
jgi:hypothetical protein